MVLQVNATFLGAANINTTWTLPLNSTNGTFTVSGNAKAFDATVLTKITQPLGMAAITKGKIKGLTYTISGNDLAATGKATLLYDNLKSLNPPLSYRIRLFYGDGYAGLPAYAPFDRILITAAAPFIPDALIAQLKIGGILVAPVGKNDIQIMTRIVKLSETEIKTETHGTFRFVPMLTDKAQDV